MKEININLKTTTVKDKIRKYPSKIWYPLVNCKICKCNIPFDDFTQDELESNSAFCRTTCKICDRDKSIDKIINSI